MTLQEKIGQKLVVGFQGYAVPETFREAVRRWKLGNVILFKHNVQDKHQLQALCADLQQLIQSETGHPAFITIDQEGGVVSRLGEDCAIMPGAMAVAASGDPDNAYRCGLITGRELRAMGVNFNLAPVLDINNNPDNPVIGVRSYGDTAEGVARYGIRMIQGLGDAGVPACAKHFPGHGDTAVDSHLDLPMVDKSLDELLQCELRPFEAAIRAGVPAMMTTHILFPQIEPEHVPATMSRRIMTDLLKKQLGFEGLVLSDCMMMQAIASYYGTVPGVVAAAKAGVDMIFTSHSAELGGQACDALLQAVESGEYPMAELDASVEKILRYKQTWLEQDTPLPGMEDVGSQAHRAVARSVLGQALAQTGAPLHPLGDAPVFLGCYAFRPTIASNPEDPSLSFPLWMAQHLGGRGIPTSIDPTDDEIAALLPQLTDCSCVVLGTYNGHIKRGQLKLAEAVAHIKPLNVVALRNPYDLFELPSAVSGLAAYAYDPLALALAAEVLNGSRVPTGVLPVHPAKRNEKR